jgi:hypothetical protein
MTEENESDEQANIDALAWFCWAAPAMIGVAATALGWVLVGILNVFFGVVCFVLGSILALTSVRRRRLLLFVLLLSNFPLALMCASIGSQNAFAHFGTAVAQIEIVNKSAVPIESVTVSFGGDVSRVGTIAVGTTGRIESPRIGRRDDMILSARLGVRDFSFALGNFDSDDVGGVMVVDVFDDGVRWSQPKWRPGY